MVSKLRAGRNSYVRMLNDENSEKELMFVDFLPERKSSSGAFHKTEYECFISLMDRVNQWLRLNSHWEIKTLESVEFIEKDGAIKTESMIYKSSTIHVRGLRLWICKRDLEDEQTQQIGFINMVPEKKVDKSLLSPAVFESLDEVIDRFNAMMKIEPIPGRIINIETVKMKIKGTMDADKSRWSETRKIDHFCFVIRIFYEITDVESAEIGIKDFTPNILKKGGLFSSSIYEHFSIVVSNASKWCLEQTDVRICNFQSLEIKVKKGQTNSQKMNFSENYQKQTYYVRILRLTYVKSASQSQTNFKSSAITQLSCRSFTPVQKTSDGLYIPEFETLDETLERICQWVKISGAIAINFETTYMRLYGPGELKYGSEATFSCSFKNYSHYWLYVIKVYINGPYVEPSVDMLPPIPSMRKEGCSVQ